MHHPDPATNPNDEQHAGHDLDLIAGVAAKDLSSAEQGRAEAQLRDCGACTSLAEDLLAIARATSALPAEPAPRDFRITTEQAARLRRTSWLARLLSPFAGSGSVVRPLAATLTTLGLVGVFVAAGLPGMLGGGGTAMAPEAAPVGGAIGATASTSAPAPEGAEGPALASAGTGDQGFGAKDHAQASAAPADLTNAGPDGSDSNFGREAAGVSSGSIERAEDPPNLVLITSSVMLAIGIALFGLRLAGRRLP